MSRRAMLLKALIPVPCEITLSLGTNITADTSLTLIANRGDTIRTRVDDVYGYVERLVNNQVVDYIKVHRPSNCNEQYVISSQTVNVTSYSATLNTSELIYTISISLDKTLYNSKTFSVSCSERTITGTSRTSTYYATVSAGASSGTSYPDARDKTKSGSASSISPSSFTDTLYGIRTHSFSGPDFSPNYSSGIKVTNNMTISVSSTETVS